MLVAQWTGRQGTVTLIKTKKQKQKKLLLLLFNQSELLQNKLKAKNNNKKTKPHSGNNMADMPNQQSSRDTSECVMFAVKIKAYVGNQRWLKNKEEHARVYTNIFAIRNTRIHEAQVSNRGPLGSICPSGCSFQLATSWFSKECCDDDRNGLIFILGS